MKRQIAGTLLAAGLCSALPWRPRKKKPASSLEMLSTEPSVPEIPAWVDPRTDQSLIEYVPRKGVLHVDLSTLDRPPRELLLGQPKPRPSVQVSLDPVSAVRLCLSLLRGSVALGAAALGTLRFLAPMLVARKLLLMAGEVGMDWYTGRYVRSTVKKIEVRYQQHYYATRQCLGRLVLLLCVLGGVGKIVERVIEWLPLLCSDAYQWDCGLLWIGVMVGMNHVVAAGLSLWGGQLRMIESPRRLQASPSLLDRLLRPEQRHALPSSQSSPLLPWIFPTSWHVVRWLGWIAAAKEMHHSPALMHRIMRQFLVQECILEEWSRCRVPRGLGVGLSVATALSNLFLFGTLASHSSLSALLMIPMVLAVLMSAWLQFSFLPTVKAAEPIVVEEPKW